VSKTNPSERSAWAACCMLHACLPLRYVPPKRLLIFTGICDMIYVKELFRLLQYELQRSANIFQMRLIGLVFGFVYHSKCDRIVTGRCHSTDSWLPMSYARWRIDGYPITRNGWVKYCIRGNRYALWLDRSVSSVTNPEECISEGLRSVAPTRYVKRLP
jgi:hypothetical protein